MKLFLFFGTRDDDVLGTAQWEGEALRVEAAGADDHRAVGARPRRALEQACILC